MRPRGRRPGEEDTRAQILASARRLFAEQGYERASMRAIAREAEVDPSLIMHYFGSKHGLLVETLQLPLDPAELLAGVAVAPPHERGERLVRAIIGAWEQPQVREHFLALLRTAASHESAREVLQTALHDSIQPVVASLAADQPARRSALVMSQMAGLAVTRYFLRMPEVEQLRPEQLVADLGPTVQRYLTGPLD
jgi:AcrR family transcriptional regulator